uniref:Uncharacterized protein n=1 Tax=Aegilops tauschii subsp. strangulata TaxID=200361 RepID=A0A453IEX3_AEGTS
MFGENQECCAQFATRTARNDNGRSFGIYVRDANEIFPVSASYEQALMDAHKQIEREMEIETEAFSKEELGS